MINEVDDIIARYPLEVVSPRQSPGQRKSLFKRRAERQYLPCFDVLDVRKDERPEVDGEIAKAGHQIVHDAAIRTATRDWVVMTAPRREAFVEKFEKSRRFFRELFVRQKATVRAQSSQPSRALQ